MSSRTNPSFSFAFGLATHLALIAALLVTSGCAHDEHHGDEKGEHQVASSRPSSAPAEKDLTNAAVTSRGRRPRTRRLDAVVSQLPESRSMEELRAAPLFSFHEGEVDRYLQELEVEGTRARLVHLARKNLGQPYEIFCLGEFPFETYDPDPLYCLQRSDCVTFAEQMVSMALSKDWDGFFTTLMKIRYRNAEIGVASRNHYTEADWNPNNAWLYEDLSEKLGVPTASYRMKVDRAANLRKQFKLVTDIPVQMHEERFIPVDRLEGVYAQLEEGDLVEVVKGKGEGRWVGHVGLFVRGPKGEPHFLHSTAPAVKEEPLPGYVARMKGRVFGFKFLRLRPEFR